MRRTRRGRGRIIETDVLVVGSGAGGAPTAALLAEAGFQVLLAEEGEWVEQGSVAPFSLEQMDRQYRSGGVTVALGLPSIAYVEGRCAGGGTEVNSGLYYRPPEQLIDRWRREFHIRDLNFEELTELSETVEADLTVQCAPGPLTPGSTLLASGADSLGWRNDEVPRWMQYPSGHQAGLRQSMTRTYLPRAAAAGARILTGLRVDRLDFVRGVARAARATLTSGDGNEHVEVRFRNVFVCCGAIHTPALLQRSGHRGHVGKTLAVHPTVKLAARFPGDVNVPDDVPVQQVKEFAPSLSFGGSASHSGLVALALSENWAAFSPAVESWRSVLVYYAAIVSEGRGRVVAIPGLRDPLVTYRLTARDRALLQSGLARLTHLMLAAGAEAVYPSFRDAPLVRTARDVAEMSNAFAVGTSTVMSVHLCSTVPMGEATDRCGADSWGRVHGCSNVFVNDSSLLPDAPGVNPQGTVMALAVRNVRRFVAERRPA